MKSFWLDLENVVVFLMIGCQIILLSTVDLIDNQSDLEQ